MIFNTNITHFLPLDQLLYLKYSHDCYYHYYKYYPWLLQTHTTSLQVPWASQQPHGNTLAHLEDPSNHLKTNLQDPSNHPNIIVNTL